MNRWLLALILVAGVVFVATACAPPPPRPAAWYSAYDDTIHYDEAWIRQTYIWYGQPGVDWLTAHEEGHRTTLYLFRRGVDVAAMMPGPTLNVRLEQAAQCEASAAGRVQPWQWGPVEVAQGYWVCPADLVAQVKAVS